MVNTSEWTVRKLRLDVHDLRRCKIAYFTWMSGRSEDLPRVSYTHSHACARTHTHTMCQQNKAIFSVGYLYPRWRLKLPSYHFLSSFLKSYFLIFPYLIKGLSKLGAL